MELSPTSSTHPNPQPHLHHRKIELQSPLDLAYLQINLTLSAHQKLDLHFPPSAYRPNPPPAQPAEFISLDGPSSNHASQPHKQPEHHPQPQPEQQEPEEDPLRLRVRSLVDAFLTRTWNGASHSISINGLDATNLTPPPSPRTSKPTTTTTTSGGQQQRDVIEREGVDFRYAPYDGKQQSHIASLYGELEALTAQVSKLRREAPRQGAQMVERALREGMDGEEGRWEDKKREGKGDVDMDMDSGIGIGEMRGDVKEIYGKGVDELARLAGLAKGEKGREGRSLTETVGKVQRARTVAMEFE